MALAQIVRGGRGRALTELVRSAITAGSLEPGAPLPSTRRLAADLGVSRGMVVDAYAQLVAEGHLVAAAGSGTRVAARSSGRTTAAPDIVVQQVAGHNPGQPDPAMFPRREWLRSLTRASAVLPDTFAPALRGTRNDAFSFHVSSWISRIRSAVISAPPEVARRTRSLMRWLRAPYDQSSVRKYG